MKLSLKQKALIETLKIFASGMLGGLIVSLMFTYFSVQTVMALLGVAVMVYLGYIVYGINLSRLESLERLKEMTEKKA